MKLEDHPLTIQCAERFKMEPAKLLRKIQGRPPKERNKEIPRQITGAPLYTLGVCAPT